MSRDLHPLAGIGGTGPSGPAGASGGRERDPNARRSLAAAAAVALAVCVLFGACGFPKAQVRGVGSGGGLIFAVDPPDADVLLDGVVRGKASRFTGDRYLEAENGTHRLELRKPGYESYVRHVYVSDSVLRIEAALFAGGSAPGGY